MKNLFMIVNPHGGLKKGLRILDKIKPIFNKKNIKLKILETEYAGHAQKFSNELDFSGYDGICAIGGDGTMHEIINGILKRKDQKKLPIGLITGGTGNAFMHDLNCLNPEHAAKRIAKGFKRNIDVVKVQNKNDVIYSFNIVSWGMSTDITKLAEKMRIFGEQRYNMAAFIEILKNKKRLVKIIIEENTYVGDYALILACNTIHTGKAMKVAPLAQLNDGMIDLIIARKSSRLHLLRLFPKLFSGDHIADQIVDYRQVKKFSIEPIINCELGIDGEILGNTPINAEVLSSAIQVLV
ncbi:MAG: hypothetical protein CMG04_08285 [Candidatus Marinimicrobia bacterium]|nr:hypothetical protein [Candidatus Neomarinimicrobiota bacterium]